MYDSIIISKNEDVIRSTGTGVRNTSSPRRSSAGPRRRARPSVAKPRRLADRLLGGGDQGERFRPAAAGRGGVFGPRRRTGAFSARGDEDGRFRLLGDVGNDAGELGRVEGRAAHEAAVDVCGDNIYNIIGYKY